ncbi:MAG: dTMP kinase [Elusimicrobiaceae bacterium]|nr:dTMP kinase [Elusimicrobiaceae bacterium]
MPEKGLFIVFEGPDRAGKTTQARKLAAYLQSRGIETVHTREPGGTPFAEAIRSILLDPCHKVAPSAELLLYEAARAQHTQQLVRPALAAGKAVLSERYTMSTVAYQGYGRGLDLKLVNRLNKAATGGLRPDLTLVFLMPDKRFSQRSLHIAADRLELEGARFRRKVRAGYRRAAAGDARAVVINADRSIEAISAEIITLVSALKAVKRMVKT